MEIGKEKSLLRSLGMASPDFLYVCDISGYWSCSSLACRWLFDMGWQSHQGPWPISSPVSTRKPGHRPRCCQYVLGSDTLDGLCEGRSPQLLKRNAFTPPSCALLRKAFGSVEIKRHTKNDTESRREAVRGRGYGPNVQGCVCATHKACLHCPQN